MRNPLARLVQLRAERPTIRQRAASLKAGLARISRKPAADAGPLVERGDDTELLRLGCAFMEATHQNEKALAEQSDREEAAHPNMPARPQCLTFRPEDEGFPLRKIQGVQAGHLVTAADIAWMTRRPMMREQARPVRPEDNLPESAEHVIERVLWPEAQARVDEIVAAWEAWPAEQRRVLAEHGVPEAKAASDATHSVVKAIADRIAALPAHTAEGMRVKLRAVAHYEEEFDTDYPGGRLLNSILRDATGKPGLPPEVGNEIQSAPPVNPALVSLVAEWTEVQRLYELEADEGLAQVRFSRIERLQPAIYAFPVASVADLCAKAPVLLDEFKDIDRGSDPAGPYWLHQAAHSVLRDLGTLSGCGTDGATAAPRALPLNSILADNFDFASASLSDLLALQDVCATIAEVAAAITCQPRCEAGGFLSSAGEVADWIKEACHRLAEASVQEMRQRVPAGDWERDTRLTVLVVDV